MDDSQKRVCVNCDCEKPIGAFPIKSAKNEKEMRHDKRCKQCKANATRAHRRTTKCEIPERKLTAKRIIEPAHTPKRTIELKVNETVSLVDRIDFADLEKSCDKTLDHIEKYDVVQRFNEFISLLREGYSEITGSHVYIKKD